jgi:hypothetical protein
MILPQMAKTLLRSSHCGVIHDWWAPKQALRVLWLCWIQKKIVRCLWMYENRRPHSQCPRCSFSFAHCIVKMPCYNGNWAFSTLCLSWEVWRHLLVHLSCIFTGSLSIWMVDDQKRHFFNSLSLLPSLWCLGPCLNVVRVTEDVWVSTLTLIWSQSNVLALFSDISFHRIMRCCNHSRHNKSFDVSWLRRWTEWHKVSYVVDS